MRWLDRLSTDAVVIGGMVLLAAPFVLFGVYAAGVWLATR